jgi:hypothetical protein
MIFYLSHLTLLSPTKKAYHNIVDWSTVFGIKRSRERRRDRGRFFVPIGTKNRPLSLSR